MIDVVFMTSNIKYPLIKSKTLCFCVISKLSEARRVSSEAPERAVSARIAVTECPQMALRLRVSRITRVMTIVMRDGGYRV